MKFFWPFLIVMLFACNREVKKDNDHTVSNPKMEDSLVKVNNAGEKKPAATGYETSGTEADKIVYADPATLQCMPEKFREPNTYSEFNPGTFGKKTYVYESPKPGARKTDSLAFATSVNILAAYPEHYLVCTPKAKSGYIKKTDLYLYNQYSSGDADVSYYYLIGLTRIGSDVTQECAKSDLKIVKIDNNKKVLDTYYDSIKGNDFTVEEIYNSTLKNVKALFYLNYHCFDEIGVEADHFIVDNGNLAQLLVEVGTGDGGASDFSNIYLPISLTKGGKVVLAKNGKLTVDQETGKPEFFPYLAKSGIPIENLVVVEDVSIQPEYDETTNDTKLNKNGDPVETRSVIQVVYYQWNGKGLRKVKTIYPG